MKRVFIVSSSPRKKGNSDILAEEFARGAREAGNEVIKFDIRGKDLKFCTGCLYCQTHDGCVQKDCMSELYEAVGSSDVLVFATPVYYYSVCGQLKTFLDRLNPLYPRDNKFRKVYLLATAVEDEDYTSEGTIKDVQGWVDCFEGVELAEPIFCGGVHDAGEVLSTSAPARAYEAGKNV